MRDVRRNSGGRGLCRGPGKIVDGVFPGQSQTFRHQRRPVDDCSPGRGRMAQNGKIREGLNGWGGRGYDDFVPEEVTKKTLPGIGLNDPLHGRQACPEFIAFDRGVGQICPR